MDQLISNPESSISASVMTVHRRSWLLDIHNVRTCTYSNNCYGFLYRRAHCYVCRIWAPRPFLPHRGQLYKIQALPPNNTRNFIWALNEYRTNGLYPRLRTVMHIRYPFGFHSSCGRGASQKSTIPTFLVSIDVKLIKLAVQLFFIVTRYAWVTLRNSR